MTPDDWDYNACNATFRSMTDQQRLMVEEVARYLGPGPELGLTSYGCGFGMFELELISRVDRETVWFQGVDSDRRAVARLRAGLDGVAKVRGHHVRRAGMTDVVGDRVAATEFGLFVQSLCYLGADEGMAVLKEARNRHQRLVIAVPPLNRLNEPFARVLATRGVDRPLFAGTLAGELDRFGVSFTRSVIAAAITVRVTETRRRLLEFLTFARQEPFTGEATRKRLLDGIAALGTDRGDHIAIDHPVELFTLG
jgi:hypothetical protein